MLFVYAPTYFFLLDLLISEREVLKSPILMIDFSVSPFGFWFCFMYF